MALSFSSEITAEFNQLISPLNAAKPDSDEDFKYDSAACGRALAKLIEVSECPVCYSDMVKPIYQCNNGHVMCMNCRPKLYNCPVCKTRLHHVRNLSLEKIINELPRRCRNFINGCPLRLAPSERETHVQDCEYRAWKCASYFYTCNFKGPLTQSNEHLRDKHLVDDSVMNYYLAMKSFSRTTSRAELWLKLPGVTHLFRCLIMFCEGRFTFLCHIISTQRHAADYKVSIDVYHTGSSRRLRYEGPVISVTDSVRHTVQNGLCLVITKPYLHSFCDCTRKKDCFNVQWHVTHTQDETNPSNK